MKTLFFSLSLTLFLYSCHSAVKEETAAQEQPAGINPAPGDNKPAVPSALPSFRMMNSNNQVVDLAQFKGKKVFVNLWATWCPPCRAEIPSIESLGARTDRSKTEFVMVSLDDNFDKARNYAVNNNMKLPVYYPAGPLPALFNTEGIPFTVIFNEKGEIIYQNMGSDNYDTQRFMDLLKAP
ncbi:MAG: TlpA family protein disulfide reductase [Sphingobacteriales bacterium]|nr:TlpA family protein disulfide reductase [Sphingobacteriales bacterium]